MKDKNRHMPERRRGTGESVMKQRRPQMLFASYGGGMPPVIIREGDRRQPRVTCATSSAIPGNTE